jgi:hypothetical protein
VTQLIIINSTGNIAVDGILSGVFGTRDASGQFQVAPELTGIYALSLMTPGTIKAYGINIERPG